MKENRTGTTNGSRAWYKRLKPLDISAILFVAGLTALTAVFIYLRGGDSGQILITGESGIWVYPADASGRIEIPGPLGITVVEFRKGAVHVEDSPCPTKSCVQMGEIDARGQWLACLPNNVFIRLEGRTGGGELEADVR